MRNANDTEIIEKVGMLAWEMYNVVDIHKYTHLHEMTNETLDTEVQNMERKIELVNTEIKRRQNAKNNGR